MKYLETLKNKLQKRPTLDRIFALTSQRDDDGLQYFAAYSQIRKRHTIGEKLILLAVEEVLKIVLHQPAKEFLIKRIPLNNNTVQRHINEMSNNIENFKIHIYS